MKFCTTCRALALGLILCAASIGASAGILYQVTDLADLPGDPDTVRIDYRISVATPDFYGYTLYFAADKYADLQAMADASDWFPTIAQPDPSAPLPGVVNLLALHFLAAGADFSVQSTWLGSGLPGPQFYEVFDDGFNIVESGMTRALGTPTEPLPEPGTIALALAGLVLLIRERRRI